MGRAPKGMSWKAKLKAAIDTTIPQAKILTIFCGFLQDALRGQEGQHVSFRALRTGTVHSCKTPGEAYTEEAITERIKGRFVEREVKENRQNFRCGLILENSIKAQQSAGYEKWAKLNNLKQAARR